MSSIDSNEKVIVVVRYNAQFRWFWSDREFWILDIPKWSQEHVDVAHMTSDNCLPKRFGIPVVNEETVVQFLNKMEHFELKKSVLALKLASLFQHAKSTWDVIELFPIMYVDFDKKNVAAFYPDGTRMEKYVPDGWTSEFEDFLELYSEEDFPTSEKFWIQNGVDMLDVLNERGRKMGSDVGQAVPDEMGGRGLLIRFYDVLTFCTTTKTFKHFPRTQRQAQPVLPGFTTT